MPKALFIDAAKRDVSEVDLSEENHVRLKEIQKLVGGPIELAWTSNGGDTLFVDEEGLLKPTQNFFLFAYRADQPMAGNGVILGREVVIDEHNFRNENPKLTAAQVAGMVGFISRAEFTAWAATTGQPWP